MNMNVIYLGAEGKAVFGTIEVEEKPKTYKVVDSKGITLPRVLIPKESLDQVIKGLDTRLSVLFSLDMQEKAWLAWNAHIKNEVAKLEDYYLEKLIALEEGYITLCPAK